MTCIGITCFYLAAKTVEEDNVSLLCCYVHFVFWCDCDTPF